MFARFAQEKGGQRLHIVEADANTKTLSATAICGRNCLSFFHRKIRNFVLIFILAMLGVLTKLYGYDNISSWR